MQAPTLYEADSKAIGGWRQVPAFTALLLITRSSGEHLPETELTQRDVADATGIGLRWIQRQWSTVTGPTGPLEQIRPGVYRGRRQAWPDLGPESWFHSLRPAVLERLLALGAEGRIALPCLRLALYLLPRLRGALHAGDPYILASDRKCAEAIGSAPITVRRAFEILSRAGLVRIDNDHRSRRILAFSLLSARPIDPATRSSDPTITINKEPKVPRDTQKTGRGARVSLSPDVAAALEYIETELDGRGPKARRLARWAGSAAGVVRWLETEATLLAGAERSRFGLLWWAATTMGSRPGKPSAAELEARRHAGASEITPDERADRIELDLEREAAHEAREAERLIQYRAELAAELDADLERAEAAADEAWTVADPDEAAAAARRAQTAADSAEAIAAIFAGFGAPVDHTRATTATTRARMALERPDLQAIVTERRALECRSLHETRRRRDEARRGSLSRFRRLDRAQ